MELGLAVKLLLIFKALVEVAGVALIGRGMVAVFAGATREQNPIYQVFKIVTNPPVWLARVLTPRKLVRETHLPLAAFFLCFWLWVGAILAITYTCASAGLTVPQCTGRG